MSKGTASMGKRNTKGAHIICRRCGRHSYHAQHKVCSSCGFGKTSKKRGYNWAKLH